MYLNPWLKSRAVAAAGLTGLMDSVEPGRACGSDTAHLGIFGYEPRLLYRGRGAFESMGAGCSMSAGDIAFKCNLATLDEESGVVVHRRVDRDFAVEGPILCEFLDGSFSCNALMQSCLCQRTHGYAMCMCRLYNKPLLRSPSIMLCRTCPF